MNLCDQNFNEFIINFVEIITTTQEVYSWDTVKPNVFYIAYRVLYFIDGITWASLTILTDLSDQ